MYKMILVSFLVASSIFASEQNNTDGIKQVYNKCLKGDKNSVKRLI